jgi:hypothetical protein
MGGIPSAPEVEGLSPPAPEWLAVLDAKWTFNGAVYDVMLGDTRTDPPTKLCMVAFHRDAERSVRLFPQSGYEDARHPFINEIFRVATEVERNAVHARLEAHEYVRLVHHQEGGILVMFARAHLQEATRAARWKRVAPCYQ